MPTLLPIRKLIAAALFALQAFLFCMFVGLNVDADLTDETAWMLKMAAVGVDGFFGALCSVYVLATVISFLLDRNGQPNASGDMFAPLG